MVRLTACLAWGLALLVTCVTCVTLVALLWEAVRVNGVRLKLPVHGGVAVTGEVVLPKTYK